LRKEEKAATRLLSLIAFAGIMLTIAGGFVANDLVAMIALGTGAVVAMVLTERYLVRRLYRKFPVGQ
jgi:energy-coupling factor transporter transmembrane protein EcfT